MQSEQVIYQGDVKGAVISLTVRWTWRHMPVISALHRLRQEDFQNLRPVWVTKQDLASKNRQTSLTLRRVSTGHTRALPLTDLVTWSSLFVLFKLKLPQPRKWLTTPPGYCED